MPIKKCQYIYQPCNQVALLGESWSVYMYSCREESISRQNAIDFFSCLHSEFLDQCPCRCKLHIHPSVRQDQTADSFLPPNLMLHTDHLLKKKMQLAMACSGMHAYMAIVGLWKLKKWCCLPCEVVGYIYFLLLHLSIWMQNIFHLHSEELNWHCRRRRKACICSQLTVDTMQCDSPFLLLGRGLSMNMNMNMRFWGDEDASVNVSGVAFRVSVIDEWVDSSWRPCRQRSFARFRSIDRSITPSTGSIITINRRKHQKRFYFLYTYMQKRELNQITSQSCLLQLASVSWPV